MVRATRNCSWRLPDDTRLSCLALCMFARPVPLQISPPTLRPLYRLAIPRAASAAHCTWPEGQHRTVLPKVKACETTSDFRMSAWVHPALDPTLHQIQIWPQMLPCGGPCQQVHWKARNTTLMDLQNLSFWRASAFRWVECSKCALVLGVWAKKGTNKPPPYRWPPGIVLEAYSLQWDADPGGGYTTGETVKTFCEQCRLHKQHPGRRVPVGASELQSLGVSTVSFDCDAELDQPPLGLPGVSAGLPAPAV